MGVPFAAEYVFGGQIFGAGAGAGIIIFSTDGIGLTLTQIGQVGALMAFIALFMQYPAGWAIDRFHALRMAIFMLVPVIIIQFIAFFYLRDFKTFVILEGAKLLAFTLYGASEVPMMIRIFPKDKYGQFCSCNGLMKAFGMMIGAAIAGFFMDFVTHNSTIKFNFRWMYMWMAIWQSVAWGFLLVVYGIWKTRGGDKGYLAPGSALEKDHLASLSSKE